MVQEREENSVIQTVSAGEHDIVLEMKNITKLYAGVVALDNVNFTVRRGEVHGLIGKNGAGKSTLVGIMSGIIQPSMGEIVVNGQSFKHLSPIVAKKHKISIITQEPQVIEESTVAENFFMPHYLNGRQIINWRQLGQKAEEILARAQFPIDVNIKVRDLTISERQLLLVIKACYVEEADIVIMDEVSASLTKRDQATLYNIIEDRVAAGKTIIFISHHTEELLQVCHRLTVLRDGRSVGSALASELTLKSLSELIVGNTNYDDLVMADKRDMVQEEVVFQLQDFTSYGKFQGINLALKLGEIVGIAGLRGSGRTELMKAVVGIDRHDQGRILVRGQEKKYKQPSAACRDGVLYMSEEREAEGLVGMAPIKHNLTASILQKFSRGGVIDKARENAKADELIKTLDVKAFSREQLINQLSGGNKQKVMVGKVMACSPRVCLLDEPTRGVDIEAKESILHTINEELRAQAGVLITSPGIDDLIKICDRILILYEGRIIDEFQRGEFDEEEIYRATQGEVIHTKGAAG